MRGAGRGGARGTSGRRHFVRGPREEAAAGEAFTAAVASRPSPSVRLRGAGEWLPPDPAVLRGIRGRGEAFGAIPVPSVLRWVLLREAAPCGRSGGGSGRRGGAWRRRSEENRAAPGPAGGAAIRCSEGFGRDRRDPERGEEGGGIPEFLPLISRKSPRSSARIPALRLTARNPEKQLQ